MCIRGEKTEFRIQNSEDRSQEAEVRKTEDRIQESLAKEVPLFLLGLFSLVSFKFFSLWWP
jgi:hypothetical protein